MVKLGMKLVFIMNVRIVTVELRFYTNSESDTNELRRIF